MADTVVDKLVIALGLDPKGIDKGISQAQSKLETGFKGIIGKVFAPLMAGMSFAGIFDSIYSELKQMNSLSKTTKASIEDVTAWSRAVNISGGSVEEFSQTLMFLNQNLTRIAITGHSRIKPFFEKLGVDATELAKKPVLDSLEAIGKAIEGMDKRESANMLRSMGFDAGTIKLLQSGEKGIRELIARQRELGVYTEKDAKAFSAMNKNFKEITSSVKTLFLPVFTSVISVMSKVTNYMTKLVTFARQNIKPITNALLILAGVFSVQLYKAVTKFFATLSISPIMKVVTVLGLLLMVIEDLWVYANGGDSALEDLWKSMGDPKDIAKGFKAIGDAIGIVFKFLSKLDGADVVLLGMLSALLPTIVTAIVGAVATAGAIIPVIIAGAIVAAIAFIYNFRDEIVEAVVVGFTVAGKMIMSLFSIVGNAIAEALSGAADIATSAWNRFITWLEEKWNWIKSLLPSLTSIANKLPGFGGGTSIAAKSGGSTNSKTVIDQKKVDMHFHTGESAKAGVKEADLAPYVDSGIFK